MAFVSNGGWIDGNTTDGVRLSLEDELSDIYVYNLRGNQRTAGEQSRKEGGKVFGSGSRNTVAVIIAVKREIPDDVCIHYRDIGDYLSADEKLDIVDGSTLDNINWQIIEPNVYGDWLDQRDEDFETWPALSIDKADYTTHAFFKLKTGGLKSNRDAWAYNFSFSRLEENVRSTIETFNSISKPASLDPKRIKWSSKFEQLHRQQASLGYWPSEIRFGIYRPFQRKWSTLPTTSVIDGTASQLVSQLLNIRISGFPSSQQAHQPPLQSLLPT